MVKTYKDLPALEEHELVLWLMYFEESVKNAYLQLNRWNDLRSGWDLQMFIVAVNGIDDAAKGLEKFLSNGNDPEVWDILEKFRARVVDKDCNLRRLRNDIVHRERLFKLQNQEGNPLPESPMLFLGTYHADKDEYRFGTHKIKLSEVFEFFNTMIKEVKRVLATRLAEFYKPGDYLGMIPFTFSLHFMDINTDE